MVVETEDEVDEVMFLGSKNSGLYHMPECRIVASIHADNLVEYTSAPDGKTLHSGGPWWPSTLLIIPTVV